MKKLLTVLMAIAFSFGVFSGAKIVTANADSNTQERSHLLNFANNVENNYWANSIINFYRKTSSDTSSKFKMLPIDDKITYTYDTVYTPKKSAVEVYKFISMEGFNANEINTYYDDLYPNATRIATADFHYNCHSYAWYSASTTKNIYWMDYPTKYYEDESFHVSTAKVGNLICYFNKAGENLHSGVITAIDSTKSGLSALTITSKWGKAGLYEHSADYCPYYPSFRGVGTYIKYYEHASHTYNNHYEYQDSKHHRAYCSCRDYILSTHYVSSKTANVVYDFQNSEEISSLIGKPFVVCALCDGLLDPDKFYPVLGTSKHYFD